MPPLDIAIVGSGVGGSLIASLNKDKNIALFEKDKNLGGCAGTFKKYGNFYNVGATTFAGYEDGHVVKEMFDTLHVKPDITQSHIAIRVLQGGNVIDRVVDFETFLDDIKKAYPNPNNEKFWRKIYQIDKTFWKLKNLFYGKYSLKSHLKTIYSVAKLIKYFKIDIFKSANSFIKETLGEINQEYEDFINAQLLITVQTTYHNIPLLSLALGLSYPFHKVFYVNGGMGAIFDELLKEVVVRRDEEVVGIKRMKNTFKLETKKGEYEAKNIVLNTSLYSTSTLFENKSIKKYYEKFSFCDQSAFVVYLSLHVKENLLHHYQVLLDCHIPNCTSNSFFVSISDKSDRVLSKNGYSVTISTHTIASFWKNLDKDEYKKQKLITQKYIVDELLKHIKEIKQEDIDKTFSATSKTFHSYIGRYNCGGKAITMKNILQIPSCKTPFRGLYNIGDTVFAGQGWPGVTLGVKALHWELNSNNPYM